MMCDRLVTVGLLAGLGAIFAAGWAEGALTINASDIAADKYVYTLGYANVETQFPADVNDRFQMDPYMSTSSGQKYVRRAEASYVGISSFTYKFDFTNAGYQIAGVSTIEQLDTNCSDSLGGISVLFSTDGVNFTKRYGLAAGVAYNYIDSTMLGSFPREWFTYDATDLGDSQVFYYRVEYEVIADSSAYRNQGRLAWGRRSSTATNPMFQASFDLVPAVPEPASLALLAMVGGGLLMRQRRGA